MSVDFMDEGCVRDDLLFSPESEFEFDLVDLDVLAPSLSLCPLLAVEREPLRPALLALVLDDDLKEVSLEPIGEESKRSLRAETLVRDLEEMFCDMARSRTEPLCEREEPDCEKRLEFLCEKPDELKSLDDEPIREEFEFLLE